MMSVKNTEQEDATRCEQGLHTNVNANTFANPISNPTNPNNPAYT